MKLLLGLYLLGFGLLIYAYAGIKTGATSLNNNLSVTALRQDKTTHQDADGCYNIFIDGGANIGVHGRFLLEPEKYPNADVAHKIFESWYGSPSTRDNRDFCVFEIEANPAHYEKLMNKSKAYAKMGWRYHVMNVGLSDQEGVLPFYRRNDVGAEEWGFSIRKFFDDAERIDVPTIRFSRWLKDHILNRKLPQVVYGTYPKNATIVVKLDIEGSEYVVLPDLISSGALCELDFVFGEFHSPNAPYDAPGMKVNLNTPQNLITFGEAMELVIRGFSRTCKVQFQQRDDEAYLHDGIPLPTPENVSTLVV